MGESIWQSMERRGYSRREFLQFCAAAATAAGLGQSGVAQVEAAFESREKIAVLWLHFHECGCCSESFTRALHPVVADALLDLKSLTYAQTLMAVSGSQEGESLTELIGEQMGTYIVLVEGAVPSHLIAKGAEAVLQTVAAGAAAIMAWGSCASNGKVQAAGGDLIGATPIEKLVDKPVIKVSGCPPVGDVMMHVATHLLVLGAIPPVESIGRSREFYGRRMHSSPLPQPCAAENSESAAISVV